MVKCKTECRENHHVLSWMGLWLNITDLKTNIVQSRYAAMRLANKEQLLLYFKTGKMLSEKIAIQKWGTKVVEQIATDLQKELPGLRGFSYRNLMNMRRFYSEYQDVMILQTESAELERFWLITTSVQICISIRVSYPITSTKHYPTS